MESDRTGRIILLNGTSSSGKTSLVRALQDRLPDPWLELGIDRFVFALPRRYLNQPGWSDVFRYIRKDGSADGPFTIEPGPLGRRLVGGMHRTAAALAEVGIDVIVDHVLLERAWLDECRRLWAPFPVLFVGVRCPLEVVLRRERERNDRTIGQAEAQFGVVHQWGGYDVEIDTSIVPAAEAAEAVASAVAAGFPDRPFRRLAI
ncbi:MAG TPA: AAA family ATPase [Candidatus Limnocylindrales bacterium]|nr:AAA family ATPase [Candidatus Limnocylindrales bacterium]